MAELTQVVADVIAPASVFPKQGIAGETITAGMPIFRHATTRRMMKSKADAEATAKCDGLALNSAYDGQPVAFQDDGELDIGAVLEEGETYGVSPDTAGKIVPVGDYMTGDWTVLLGIANDVDIFRLAIKASEVPLGGLPPSS